MEKIKISVIVPVYNVEEYLAMCIESILHQTMNRKLIEIILINDGSTDDSLEICCQFQNANSNIIVINQENRGPSAARNRGLALARGEYIQFLDADDWLQEETLNYISKIMDEKKLDMACYDAETLNEVTGFSEVCIYNREKIIKNPEILSGNKFLESYMTKGGYFVHPGMCMYKKSFLQESKIIFPEGRLFEDEIFSLELYLKAERVLYVPRAFYMRRYRNESTMTSQVSNKKLEDKIWVVNEIAKIIERNQDTMSGKLLGVIKTYLQRLMGIVLNMAAEMGEEENKKRTWEVIKEFLGISKKLAKKENIGDIRWFLKLLNEGKKIPMTQGMAKELLKIQFENRFLTVWLMELYYHDKLRMLYIGYFAKLGLSDASKRIGIYGMGEHTKKFLQLYHIYMGDINANMVFLDSNKESHSEDYMGYDVINIKEADKYADEIVISSFLYEEEMYKTVKKYFNDNIKVHRFYEEETSSLF